MKNSAFGMGNGRRPSLAELVEHPVFTNVVRLFLIVILSLGGYIWKTEMEHVNGALADIKTTMNENIRRQWTEVNAVKKEVSQVNLEVSQILYRTNQMLFEVLQNVTGPDVRPRRERRGAAPLPDTR